VTGPRPATAMRARAPRSNRSLQLAVLLGELNELLLDLRERILRRLLAGNRQAQLAPQHLDQLRGVGEDWKVVGGEQHLLQRRGIRVLLFDLCTIESVGAGR